jgi:hypothetical protein
LSHLERHVAQGNRQTATPTADSDGPVGSLGA